MIDFSKMPCVYWSDVTKISYLQRRIIVYSIMYYENDESCISDGEYDSISRQLMDLKKKASKEDWEKSTYYYAMHDFDGSTGFDIPSRLTKKDRKYLTRLANTIHKQWKKEKLISICKEYEVEQNEEQLKAITNREKNQ